MVIPWEGKRLLECGQRPRCRNSNPASPVKLLAMRERRARSSASDSKSSSQEMLSRAGAKSSQVQVLCAYKPGVSWLMDEIAPQLKGKPVASLKIEFRKNDDPSGTRAMFSPARWVHELYPVDEMLSQGARASRWTRSRWRSSKPRSGKSPTYRVHAYDAAGKEMLAREFTVTTVKQPYNGVMPEYENVEVDTGWVRMESGSRRDSRPAAFPPISSSSGITITRTRCRRSSAP